MNMDIDVLLESSRRKTLDAIMLVNASLERLKPYESLRQYTPLEREPYDALSDRFIRAVELSLRYFRTLEEFEEAIESETLRDRLLKMEKIGIISSLDVWFKMRDVRNRIVHEYLPEQIKDMYADIMGDFGIELNRLVGRIQK